MLQIEGGGGKVCEVGVRSETFWSLREDAPFWLN